VPEGDDPNAEKRMLLAIASQPIDTDTSYTVGGDVSRFQRRSVPSRAPSAPSGGDSVAQLASAMMRNNGAPASAPAAGGPVVLSGPVVRVSRGNTVTLVPVGAR